MLTKPGWYLAKVTEWAVIETKNGAISIRTTVQTLGDWDADRNEWVAVAKPEDGFGDFYVVKKNGEVSAAILDQLHMAGIWEGDFIRFDAPPPENFQVVIDCISEIYEGKTYVRPKFIYYAEHKPGSRRASREKLMALQDRFGAAMRAVKPA